MQKVTVIGSVIGGIAVLGAAGASLYEERRQAREFAADVATLCNAEASSGARMDRDRYGVEEWAAPRLHSARARTFFGRLRREAPDAAAADLRATSARLRECPSALGYEALARRTVRQRALDKMCREFDPGDLRRTPRGARVGLLLAWARQHLGHEEVDVQSVLGPLREAPLEDAAPELRRRLADLEIHVCSMMSGLAAPSDPKPGPNVLLDVASVGDGRQPEVASAIRARLPAIERCYAAELATSPALAGRLDLKFRLTPKGTVDLALPVEDSTLPSAAVAGCSAAQIKNIVVDGGTGAATGGAVFDFFVVR